jgi:F0F1-type ATP synthase assembly protein I
MVSELDEQLRKARKLALIIVGGQTGLVLAVAAASWGLAGSKPGLSALLGGGIGACASLYMAVSVFRREASAEPRRILGRFFRAEFYKLVITAVLFGAVIRFIDVSIGFMLIGLAATLLMYWFALLLRLD